MDDTGKRLKQFLFIQKITQRAVSNALGTSAQYINAVCQGRSALGKQMAFKLERLFGISAAWLLTGDGSMLVDDRDATKISVNEELAEDIKAVQNYKKGKPYYNVDFALGFDIMENDQTTTPQYLIDFTPYNHCDCWCNAHGDSMHPTISSGDIVALKRIYSFDYLINGEIYAIVTSNGLRTIKRVMDEGDKITLIADNPAIEKQQIPKEIITHIYHILGVVKQF